MYTCRWWALAAVGVVATLAAWSALHAEKPAKSQPAPSTQEEPKVSDPAAHAGEPVPPAAEQPQPTDWKALSEAEWRKRLTPEQYRVVRQKGTERAFTGEYWNSKKQGTYKCVACGLELFASETKFDSGCGWPSFFAPVAKDAVATAPDFSHNMRRIEVLCPRCGAHLGHVFPDGPRPTGLRYCINSLSLKLDAKPAAAQKPATEDQPAAGKKQPRSGGSQ